MAEPSRVLLVRDIAKRLRMSDKAVRGIPPSELPYMQQGEQRRGHRRYMEDDVVAYIERYMVRS